VSAELSYLVDTNILLRLAREADPQYKLILAALDELDARGAELYFSLQNVAELWNVCTRPAGQNGFGFTVEETIEQIGAIELNMTLLPDNEMVYEVWKRIVSTHRVKGVQVHDARLAAIMEVHGIRNILTLNQVDFKRFSQVVGVHPAQIR
jgi:predicted nucleic acid-binding protein